MRPTRVGLVHSKAKLAAFGAGTQSVLREPAMESTMAREAEEVYLSAGR